MTYGQKADKKSDFYKGIFLFIIELFSLTYIIDKSFIKIIN
jgi:hypothetical protein